MDCRLLQHNGVRCPQLASFLLLLLVTVPYVESWGNGNNNDLSLYSDNYYRDWLEDGSTVSIKIHGCVESYVDDGEDAGCMEEDSDDGTTYWYMMSNCKRANVVYSLYSANNCNNGNFEETVRPCLPLDRVLVLFNISHALFSISCSL